MFRNVHGRVLRAVWYVSRSLVGESNYNTRRVWRLRGMSYSDIKPNSPVPKHLHELIRYP